MASHFSLLKGWFSGLVDEGEGERGRESERVCVCGCVQRKARYTLTIPLYLKTMKSLLAPILVIVVSGKHG